MAFFYQLFDISTASGYLWYGAFPANENLVRGGFSEKLLFQIVTQLWREEMELQGFPESV